MKRQIIRNRKMRFGVLTVVLTVLVVAVTVLANAVFATLAKRYSWYSNLNETPTYAVTEDCFDFLGTLFEKHPDGNIELIFCEPAEALTDDVTQRYVYNTATALAARYPERVRVTCHDIWENPNSVRAYAESTDPVTGEVSTTLIKSTSLIVVAEDYHRVYSIEEFFVFENGNLDNVWAYNGEKKIAAGIMRALSPTAPVAALTSNHGEVYYDYELLYLLDDAGYSLAYIDLYRDAIPANCNLIVSYNPNSDLVADDVSEKSELDILSDFLAKDGNSFLLLVENGTPKLPNYERFLEEWGVSMQYHTDSVSGKSYRYMVQDASQSLTSDGYTIYGEPSAEGRAAEMLSGVDRRVIFKNATGMGAATGFVSNGDGSYTKGNRTLYNLYSSADTAVSWANGSPVSGEPVMLMTLTEQKIGNATSSVGVIASVKFSSEEFLQSAVFGNSDAALRMLALFGREDLPEGLTIKPFSSQEISIITTAQMLSWTLSLALIPALAVTLVGLIVLVRRRNA